MLVCISRNLIDVTMLLILFNHLLSCFQRCLKGLAIFTMHGFDFGVGVILAPFAWCDQINRCFEVCFNVIASINHVAFALQKAGPALEP